MQKRNKKIAVIVTTIALVAVGGGAFAYWTLYGTGSGSASTGVASGEISAHQTSVVSDLRPGGAPQALSGNFNNTDDSPVYVTSVEATVTGVEPAVEGGDCEINDYVISGGLMSVNAQVASGDSVGSWSGATLAFKNEAAENQDGCQGATVTIGYVIH